jgi:hypothetical protein
MRTPEIRNREGILARIRAYLLMHEGARGKRCHRAGRRKAAPPVPYIFRSVCALGEPRDRKKKANLPLEQRNACTSTGISGAAIINRTR